MFICLQNQESECNEMDNVAALAESIQPKGNTLLTTSVRIFNFYANKLPSLSKAVLLYFACCYFRKVEQSDFDSIKECVAFM